MQYIRQEIQKGNLQLAKLDAANKPVPMEYSQLQQKRDMQNRRVQILKKLKELSPDEKKEWVYIRKLKANQFFKSKAFSQAIQAYLQAMLGLELSQSDPNQHKAEDLELKYPIMLNIATCFYRQQQHSKALEMCNKIISEKHGQAFPKAYYKKAYILVALSQYDQARDVIKQGIISLQSAPSCSIGRQDFIKIKAEIDSKSQTQRDMYANMFKREEDEQSEQEEPLTRGAEKSTKKGTRKEEKIRQQELLYYRQSWWQGLWECCSRSFDGVFTMIPWIKRKQK